MCALGGISLWQIGEVYQSAADLADNWLPSIEGLGDVRGAVSNVQRSSLLVILESSPAAMQARKQQHDAAVQGYEKAYARYTTLISSPEEGELARMIEAKWTAYQQSDKAMLDAARSGANQGEAHAIAVGRAADDFARPSSTRASSR